MTQVLSIFGVRPFFEYMSQQIHAMISCYPFPCSSWVCPKHDLDVRQMGMEESTAAMGADVGSGQLGGAWPWDPWDPWDLSGGRCVMV